jgi:hypothetical protein
VLATDGRAAAVVAFEDEEGDGDGGRDRDGDATDAADDCRPDAVGGTITGVEAAGVAVACPTAATRSGPPPMTR